MNENLHLFEHLVSPLDLCLAESGRLAAREFQIELQASWFLPSESPEDVKDDIDNINTVIRTMETTHMAETRIRVCREALAAMSSSSMWPRRFLMAS